MTVREVVRLLLEHPDNTKVAIGNRHSSTPIYHAEIISVRKRIQIPGATAPPWYREKKHADLNGLGVWDDDEHEVLLLSRTPRRK